jgi:hypothetical protein
MKTFAFLLVILSLAPVLQSQSTWSLGLSSVVEKDGRGLGGASIELLQGSSVVKKSVSAANGFFSMDVPGNGEYLLKVSYQDCNAKTFLIKTTGVPQEIIERDNNHPTMKIDGVTMKRPLYSINYSALKMPMAKIMYVDEDKKFGHDEAHTNKMLDALDAIREAEIFLLEKHTSAIKEGDAALKKKDCPLAKKNYEAAIKLIPEAPYDEEPKLKLSQADKCIEEKAGAEAAKANQEQEALKQAEADKLAKELVIKEKLNSEKLAAEKAEKDKQEAEKSAKQKSEAEKAAKEKIAADKAVKEKAAKEKEKSEELAKEKAVRDKKDAYKLSQQQLEAEKLVSEKAAADQQKIEAERLANEKAAKEEAAKLAKQNSEQEARERSKNLQDEKIAKAQQDKLQAEADKIAKEKKLAAEVAKAEATRAAKEKELSEKTQLQKANKDKQEQEVARQKEKTAKDKAAKADTKNKLLTDDKAEAKKQNTGPKNEKSAESGETLVNEEIIQQQQAQSKQKESAMKGGHAVGNTNDKESRRTKEGKSQSIPKILGSKDNYREAVKNGDEYFVMKRWEEARKSYQEALLYKKEDPYATRKISEIDKIAK